MISIKDLVKMESFLNKDNFSNIKLEYINPIYNKAHVINLFAKFDVNRINIKDLVFDDGNYCSEYLIPTVKRTFEKFPINIFHYKSWKKLLINSRITVDENFKTIANIKVNDYDYFGFNNKMKQKVDQKIIDFICNYVTEDDVALKLDKSSYLYSEIKKRMILM